MNRKENSIVVFGSYETFETRTPYVREYDEVRETILRQNRSDIREKRVVPIVVG